MYAVANCLLIWWNQINCNVRSSKLFTYMMKSTPKANKLVVEIKIKMTLNNIRRRHNIRWRTRAGRRLTSKEQLDLFFTFRPNLNLKQVTKQKTVCTKNELIVFENVCISYVLLFSTWNQHTKISSDTIQTVN